PTMAAGAHRRIPKLVPGIDVRSLPLGPLEGFVLSRIDGQASIHDLASLTGLGDEAVSDIVARLAELGAVTVDGGPPSAPPRPPLSSVTPTRGITVRSGPAPPEMPRALYDPAELEEDVELDFERRRLVLDTFYRLDI